MSAVDDRQLGIDLFNATWELLDASARTADDDNRMIHTAHASAYHWRQVGTAANVARSEWLCSRVYSVLRRCEPALHHARSCLDLCRQHDIDDWDRAFAHEALARAHAILGNADVARAQAEQALAVTIADAADRDQLLADLATVPGLEHFW